MSLKMSEFHGVDPKHLEALKTAGIEDTDALMKTWSDKTKRAELSTSTGISEEQFLKFASMARLGRIKGMDLKHISVLVAAGIDGPKRLFSHTPDTLVKHLTELAATAKVTDPMPTLADVTVWFANPRPETNGSAGPGAKAEVVAKS